LVTALPTDFNKLIKSLYTVVVVAQPCKNM